MLSLQEGENALAAIALSAAPLLFVLNDPFRFTYRQRIIGAAAHCTAPGYLWLQKKKKRQFDQFMV